ncbi:MAG: phosphoribosylformylglycinamidine synthase subunit PurS [Coriobacteriia bacterium]|nr:phosphoribosylformylglycinamidine synthase subunit PurS [Coriobacteriia bacterium]
MARYEIFVTYKKGIFDPPGETAQRALQNLGYDEVTGVRIGKYIRLEVDGGPGGLARVREMCDRLLANPVIEDYRIEAVGEAAEEGASSGEEGVS